MTAVLFAKWSGDFLTHPLYHALLEVKCIPFLEPEPVVALGDGAVRVNLELYTVGDIMRGKGEVVTFRTKEKVFSFGKIAQPILKFT